MVDDGEVVCLEAHADEPDLLPDPWPDRMLEDLAQMGIKDRGTQR